MSNISATTLIMYNARFCFGMLAHTQAGLTRIAHERTREFSGSMTNFQ
jgi:hypothetical protein